MVVRYVKNILLHLNKDAFLWSFANKECVGYMEVIPEWIYV